MARGMLTGKLDMNSLPDGDFRKTGTNPQFDADNIDQVRSLYRSHKCDLQWILRFFCNAHEDSDALRRSSFYFASPASEICVRLQPDTPQHDTSSEA